MTQEDRQAERAPWDAVLDVFVTEGSRTYTIEVRGIERSETGLAFISSKYIEPTATVESEEEDDPFTGEVVACTEQSGRFRVGIAFT